MNENLLPLIVAVLGSTGFMSVVQLFLLPEWKKRQEINKARIDEEQSVLTRKQAEGEDIENDNKRFGFYTAQIKYLMEQVAALQGQVDTLKAKEASHTALRDAWAEEKRNMGQRISQLDQKVTSLSARLSKYEKIADDNGNGSGNGSGNGGSQTTKAAPKRYDD